MAKTAHFQHFNKYDFVKAYVSKTVDPKQKEEKEREAVLIADAFEETQQVLFENLATKKDLVHLEQRLTIRLTAIMAALLTFLPLVTQFLKVIF